MNSIQKNLHVGIYGLIAKRDQLLVVRKSRGPYQGLFDLPGGRPFHGEPLLNALTREIKEETGIAALSYSLFGNFSFLIPYLDLEGNQRELYHIGLTYQVNEFNDDTFNGSIIDEDVSGSLWINYHAVDKKMCSPLLTNVLEIYATK